MPFKNRRVLRSLSFDKWAVQEAVCSRCRRIVIYYEALCRADNLEGDMVVSMPLLENQPFTATDSKILVGYKTAFKPSLLKNRWKP